MISFRAPRSVKSRVLGLNVGDIKARKWYLVVILLLYIGLITSFCLNISLLLRTYPKQNESSQTTTTLKSKGDFRYFYLPSLILWANILNNNSHLHFFEDEKMKNVTLQISSLLRIFYYHLTRRCCVSPGWRIQRSRVIF